MLGTAMNLTMLGVMTGLYVTGSILMAKAVKTEDTVLLAAAYALFMFGNFFYLRLMAMNGLGVTATLSAVAQTVALVLAARFLFGEALGLQKLIGMAVAVLGVAIMNLPPFWGR